MLREKITGWLEKLKQIKNHIDIECAPTITLFNIINITLFKSRLKLKPEEWRDEDKRRIAEFLSKKIGITLKEFEELLKKEIKEVSEEKQKLIRELLTRLLVENPLIPLEEFERRSEIKPMLKYEFIGREVELEKLRKFLESDEKVFLLTGDGGVGKTRLAIEFARKLKASDKWDAYFIDQNRDFKHFVVFDVLDNKNTLLILDEASRYRDRDRVIEFIRNPPESRNIKLLLIERTLFEDSTENTLKEKEIPFQSYKLGKGDIVSFLKKYFGIENEVAEAIEKECMNSFVFAAFFGEFYKEKGRVGTLKEVLENRTEKYIRDIEIETNIPFRDVKNTIFLLSLITPVKEKYLKYFKEIFEELWGFNYEHLKKIIGLALAGKSNIIVRYGEEGKEEYAIKPDPVADYLRAEFMKEKIFKNIVMKFLPFVPLNISYNIFVTQRFTGVSSEVSQILGEIWAKLNEIEGKTPEYFSALVLFTGDFSSFPFFDVEKINISHWVSCYEKVSKNYPEKEVREELAMGLFSAVAYYGEENEFGKMELCLNELRELHEKYPEKEVREKLAMGLFNAAKGYGEKNEFEKIEKCLKELRELHKKYPEKEVRESLVMSLVTAMNHYGEKEEFGKMEARLNELRELHKKYQEKKIRNELAGCLINAMEYYGKKNEFERVELCLNELRELHNKHQEKEMRILFAAGLVNAVACYGKSSKLRDMEACLKELRELHKKYPEKEVRKWLAVGLVNATLWYGEKKDFKKMETYLTELKELHKKYPEKEIRDWLAWNLFNTMNSYKKADKFNEMPYENLVLLYKLRFDLPDELPDELREEKDNRTIEDLFVKATKGKIERIHNKKEDLREFLTFLKAELGDTEIVLLMNEISEELDIRIQKKLWKLLNELLSL